MSSNPETKIVMNVALLLVAMTGVYLVVRNAIEKKPNEKA